MDNKCPLFYCEFPKFVILFKGKDVAGLGNPVVIMNTSTRRMRDSMDKLSMI
jgi:hypothetical protein